MTKRNKNYQQYIPSIPKKKLKTKDNLTVYQKAHFKTHIIFTVQFKSSQITNQIKNHNEQNTNISTKLVDYFPPLYTHPPPPIPFHHPSIPITEKKIYLLSYETKHNQHLSSKKRMVETRGVTYRACAVSIARTAFAGGAGGGTGAI